MSVQEPDSKLAAHKQFAVEFNNQTWTLLEKPDRTEDDNALMVHSAHASLRHWLEAGGPANQQRGEWLLARVYGVLHNADMALSYAKSCLALTEKHSSDMQDFDLAFAYEGIARANALAGHEGEALHYRQLAAAAGAAIVDAEDRQIFLADFAAGMWGGLQPPAMNA